MNNPAATTEAPLSTRQHLGEHLSAEACGPAAGCACRNSPIFREKNTPPTETVVILVEAPKRHTVGQIPAFVRLSPPLRPSVFPGLSVAAAAGKHPDERLKFKFPPQVPARASRRLEAAVSARG